MLYRGLAISTLVLASACSDEGSNALRDARPDSAFDATTADARPGDAGDGPLADAAEDAAVSPLADGGASLADGGVSPPDGGVSLPDGGVSLADAGVSLADAGVSLADAGVSLADAALPDANPNASGTLIETFSPPGGGIHWTCPDGTLLALSNAVSKQSTICLGIDGSECPQSGVTPGPGDPECDEPSFNAFKDTCVETFFSCFDPSGTCSIEANNNQTWGNGALQDRNFMSFIASYQPSSAAQPCITATLGDGIVSYSR